MVIQVIESRYTVEYDVLVDFLTSMFGASSYEIVVPDEGEKWKIKVPRELTRDELVDLQRKFRQALG
ncbi:hypothetical protein COCC4DRAFT_33488 [Bipolaris maydis ATCC 48331]|uniref:Uncharacterized protein n=2 Tax=Cochliobolus heterostrophus TaxID=5016 RepID=M2UVJ6_COCH5|nr:uncharacterized protein COCC4DRAFT_33488 [Bipolaris maydis ATCC 48331]EMD91848.1 hypothetical protein COCHEDRAFT_1020921 [Bipolaris maydis C5]KAJ5020653.1 hypothetical protein J3E73DRAFT_359795 [Bipolaris maydis]ENI02667.1 hypothetical protein COCC4DRAFT_33488 [Bipolaris maydis ATCC 48331]KAJ5020760.1 hypothetical protein J3E73DRAFT_358553 [Bipolaris maydis]KAJ5020981.1 hypothetical protein J3E73DRAFT_356554 [Bipolaris maydis]